MNTLMSLAARLRSLPEKAGRHRTDNRSGHYTLDGGGMTLSLRDLVKQGSGWIGGAR